MQEIIDTCDFFIGEGRRLYGQTVPSEMPDKQLFTFRVPVGVAAIITAGNFPVAVPVLVPRPGDPVRQRRRLEAGRVLAPRSATRSRGCSCTPAASPAACSTSCSAEGAATFDGPRARARRSGSSTRSASPARAPSAPRSASSAAATCSRPCLELGGKNPLVVMADADLDLAVEGALFSGFGTAGPALHLARRRGRPRGRPRRVRQAARRARARGRRSATRPRTCSTARCSHERFADRFEEWLGADRRTTTTVHGSSATGRIAADAPREGFVGDPEAGLFYHPTIVTGVTKDDELYTTETFGPIVGGREVRDLRRGDRARQRPRLRALVGDLHEQPAARLPLPRARDARAWSRSTTRRRAPRRTCPSAATASPATARASRASGCSTSSPAGSR